MTAPTKRPTGRPRNPQGVGKTERIEWRTTAALKARAGHLAAASGLSVSQWLDRVVGRAKAPITATPKPHD